MLARWVWSGWRDQAERTRPEEYSLVHKFGDQPNDRPRAGNKPGPFRVRGDMIAHDLRQPEA